MAAGVFKEEKGETCKALGVSSCGTHTLSFLLCSTGQNKSRGQPTSRGGEIVDTIPGWKELKNSMAMLFPTTTPLLLAFRVLQLRSKNDSMLLMF